jgi:ABC-type transport system involved in cytochrome c biogenesis permease subunit
MMNKGKILKIRMGHEANCSSGMVSLLLLMIGTVTYVPLSVITAAVQAKKMPEDAPKGRKLLIYLIIPQVLGLAITAYLVYQAYTAGYNPQSPLVLALVMGCSFALSVAIGYTLASRMRYLNCLVVPSVLVAGFFVFNIIAVLILQLLS